MAPHAPIYLDAAHGGWLGYTSNADKFTDLIVSMNITHLLRGFSTNVANYQPLGFDSVCPGEAFEHGLQNFCQKKGAKDSPCCKDDPCHLAMQGGAPSEISYAQILQRIFIEKANWSPYFVIDTGRNGAPPKDPKTCPDWCNVRDAGAGHVPTMNTGLPDVVDAFFWLKPPGESDGCTQVLPSGFVCPRFDGNCGRPNALGSKSPAEPAAPEAGEWYDYQIKMLARNSDLRKDAPGALDATWYPGKDDGDPAPPTPPPSKPIPTIIPKSLPSWAKISIPPYIPRASPPLVRPGETPAPRFSRTGEAPSTPFRPGEAPWEAPSASPPYLVIALLIVGIITVGSKYWGAVCEKIAPYKVLYENSTLKERGNSVVTLYHNSTLKQRLKSVVIWLKVCY